jgi:hypothetical protein
MLDPRANMSPSDSDPTASSAQPSYRRATLSFNSANRDIAQRENDAIANRCSEIRIQLPRSKREKMKVIAMLIRFYEIGMEYQRGVSSLRQIAGAWEKRCSKRDDGENLPMAPCTVSRSCKDVAKYFAECLQLDTPAPLFACERKGKPMYGLTELGTRAWQAARDYLIMHDYVQENS